MQNDIQHSKKHKKKHTKPILLPLFLLFFLAASAIISMNSVLKNVPLDSELFMKAKNEKSDLMFGPPEERKLANAESFHISGFDRRATSV